MAISRRLGLGLLSASHRRPVLSSPYLSSASYATATSTTTPMPPTSVSQTEMNHFSALAASWWDPHGSSSLLHQMNPLRHAFIKRCMSSTTRIENSSERKLSYLDIGCGGGIFAESAARLPHTRHVVAIDPAKECIAVAKNHQRKDPALTGGKLQYLHTDIESLALAASPSQRPDVVTLFEVVEHVQNPAVFMEKCLQHVRPGGWFILSTISRTWTSWLTTKVAAEYILGIVPRGTHNWAQYINVDEMKAWACKQQGWDDFSTMGVVYAPGLGWREVNGSESWGNYFFAMRRQT